MKHVSAAIFVALGLAGAGCGQDAEATPPSGGVEPETNLRVDRAEAPHDDVVTPGEDGVIDPMEDRVVLPPEVMSKPDDEGIGTPDARDQLERGRVEGARPE